MSDVKLSWAMQKEIDHIEAAFADREAFLQNGGVVRDHYGSRLEWRDTLPTAEERKAAKKALAKPGKNWVPDAYCPCCNQRFLIPSVWESVKKYGLCGMCRLFEEGKFDGVARYRDPTIEEVLALPAWELRRTEVMVLAAEVRRLRATNPS